MLMQQTIVFVFSKTELNEKYLHAFNLSTKNLNRITIKVSEECNEKTLGDIANNYEFKIYDKTTGEMISTTLEQLRDMCETAETQPENIM